MMTTATEPPYLSLHSSNPLQVPSDDPLNASYVEQLRPILDVEKSRAARGLPPKTSSTPIPLHEKDSDDENGGKALHSSSRTRRRTGSSSSRDHAVDDSQLLHPRDARGVHQFDADDVPENDFDRPEPTDDHHVAADDDEIDGVFWKEGSEDSEDRSIYQRHPTERAQVEAEIQDLQNAIPGIEDRYLLLDRLGEGTFSSVYKALDLDHDLLFNRPWEHTSSESTLRSFRRSSKFYVAIKRIYVTSGPNRIANEISILEDCRGCRHVSQLITAFRSKDQVVAIMPYSKNADFRDFYQNMTIPAIQAYFRCLFRALRDIHARGVVHRDVKPANFLFNPADNIGTLCDFGLAQRVEGDVSSTCLHTSPTPSELHGRHKPLKESHTLRIKDKTWEARRRATTASDRIGIPMDENRPSVKANRAGTRGFRAPEVLFKCPDQSVALDVWSAGTILLTILGCKFPIFTASDDVEALMELAAVFGKRSMEKCARLHNRTFATNVPSVDHTEISWAELVQRINPYLYQTQSKRHFRSSAKHPSRLAQSPPLTKHNRLIDSAIDLMSKCLHWDPTVRITARDALYHPFLSEDQNHTDGDDDSYPHPFGDGVCGNLHFRDEVTDDLCIVVPVDESRSLSKALQAGEGIATGKEPCEFHQEGALGTRVPLAIEKGK